LATVSVDFSSQAQILIYLHGSAIIYSESDGRLWLRERDPAPAKAM
jgi:hypothetical protein